VVAEGVETEQELEWLRANGCDVAQGYFIAKPTPAAELAARVGAQGVAASTGA
jgi:EAL domain-containing protein (putative c-di-GMP-specific phosphodiesterase class I)